jgi:hypothetical protein
VLLALTRSKVGLGLSIFLLRSLFGLAVRSHVLRARVGSGLVLLLLGSRGWVAVLLSKEAEEAILLVRGRLVLLGRWSVARLALRPGRKLGPLGSGSKFRLFRMVRSVLLLLVGSWWRRGRTLLLLLRTLLLLVLSLLLLVRSLLLLVRSLLLLLWALLLLLRSLLLPVGSLLLLRALVLLVGSWLVLVWALVLLIRTLLMVMRALLLLVRTLRGQLWAGLRSLGWQWGWGWGRRALLLIWGWSLLLLRNLWGLLGVDVSWWLRFLWFLVSSSWGWGWRSESLGLWRGSKVLGWVWLFPLVTSQLAERVLEQGLYRLLGWSCRWWGRGRGWYFGIFLGLGILLLLLLLLLSLVVLFLLCLLFLKSEL